ncbi:MAG: hypothetical protein E7384_02645 [Ruminococcaceae bacterium]|nr:hypothetical protein [Oscillospiraceae bacterium]
MDKVVFIISKIVFGICTVFLLGVLIMYSSAPHLCKNPFLPINFLVVAGALLLTVLVAMLIYHTRAARSAAFAKLQNFALFNKCKIDYFVIAASILLFAAKIFIAFCIYFETGWDVKNTTAASELLAFGSTDGFIEEYYFGMYPNNLFYVFIQAIILKIASPFSIFESYKMMPVIIVNCALASSACYLTYKTTALYTRKRYAFGAFILAVLTFGISPWAIIPYTDSFGIIFPIASFYLFVKPAKSDKSKYINIGFATLLAIFGYLIKPQCLIIVIALLIFEFIYAFRKIHIKNFIKPVAILLAVCIISPLITLGVTQVAVINGVEVDPGKKFGPAHYFMMGLNTDRQGVWAEEDVEFSKMFISTRARNQADLERAFNRLENMEDGEYTELLRNKILITLNDGTYAWGQEGGFFDGKSEPAKNNFELKLRSYVYMWDENYKSFSYFSHIVWITIFLLSTVSVIFKASDEKGRKEIPVLMLAILGLILFELLFEARARYIYTYLPVFCILAALGANGAVHKIGLYLDHKKHSKEFDFY